MPHKTRTTAAALRDRTVSQSFRAAEPEDVRPGIQVGVPAIRRPEPRRAIDPRPPRTVRAELGAAGISLWRSRVILRSPHPPVACPLRDCLVPRCTDEAFEEIVRDLEPVDVDLIWHQDPERTAHRSYWRHGVAGQIGANLST